MAAGSSTDPSSTDFARDVVSAHEDVLLRTAGQSIMQGLTKRSPLAVDPKDFPPPLTNQCGSFITLEKRQQLRGCIGTIEAHRPLIVDVAENAFGAAFRDPRFKPLRHDEVKETTCSISVLNPMTPMVFDDEAHLLSQLIPGETGLLIQDHDNRAVFLPQVWESLPTPQAFLSRLKVKARLREDHWSEEMHAWRFHVAKTRKASFEEIQNGPDKTTPS